MTSIEPWEYLYGIQPTAELYTIQPTAEVRPIAPISLDLGPIRKAQNVVKRTRAFIDDVTALRRTDELRKVRARLRSIDKLLEEFSTTVKVEEQRRNKYFGEYSETENYDFAPFHRKGLCRCLRRDQHLVGGGLKTGSNGPFVTKCGQCRSQRDKPFTADAASLQILWFLKHVNYKCLR